MSSGDESVKQTALNLESKGVPLVGKVCLSEDVSDVCNDG